MRRRRRRLGETVTAPPAEGGERVGMGIASSLAAPGWRSWMVTVVVLCAKAEVSWMMGVGWGEGILREDDVH